MEGPQEMEKPTNGVSQSTLLEEPTLVDLNTPQKMVSKLLPFIQPVPDQVNAEPSGHPLTPLSRLNNPPPLPTPHLVPED